MAHITTEKRKSLKPSQVGLPSRDKKGPKGGAPRGDYPVDTKGRARAAKAYASKEEHEGKLSKAQEREIDRKADKKLGEKGGKGRTISPKHERESVHVRKIANGYMVRHMGKDGMESEHYSDEAPKIRVK